MKRIPLSKGQFALVDDRDFEKLSAYSWYASFETNTWYAKRGEAYGPVIGARGRRKMKQIRMSRDILQLSAGQLGDHRDGNGLNNRRGNLRPCSKQQNSFNSRKQKGTSSRYKGVIWDKTRGLWKSEIRINGRTKFLGRHDSETEAARKYDAAAVGFVGEFARINFPKIKVD